MRLRTPILLSAAAVVAAGACAPLGTVAPPVTPALVGASRGASAETLAEGRRVFVGPCTSCHQPDPMGKHTLAQWRTAIADMANRAKLDPARRAALLAYVSAAKTADLQVAVR